MQPLPQALYRAQDARELDRIATAELSIPSFSLMTRAGEAAFACLRRAWPRARHIAVVCGDGNNGGDGLVVARLAHEAGMHCDVYLMGPAERLKGDARLAYEGLRASGARTLVYKADQRIGAEVVVDALFGTGLDRAVSGDYAAAIAMINHQSAPVVSLDIPSGLHADSGVAMGAAVRATLTVSFIALKQGMFTAQGPDYCGAIVLDDLGVPEAVYQRVPAPARRIAEQEISALLPPRPRSAHKGQNGHVLVVGGAPGMAGAARMAGEAAARVGAGLISVATHPSHATVLNASRPELMVHGVVDGQALAPLLAKADVVAIGPGLGSEAWGRQLLGAVMDSSLPLVVDADALNLLAQDPLHRNQWVLTPHPGEAARLLGVSTSEVQADRWHAVRELHKRYGGVSILKGAGTLVCQGSAPVALCDTGNPGMSSGGMGDVLTGVIAGLVAQGLSLWQAATAGVYLHGRAGDLAAAQGERGLMASDLLPHLRSLVNPQPS